MITSQCKALVNMITSQCKAFKASGTLVKIQFVKICFWNNQQINFVEINMVSSSSQWKFGNTRAEFLIKNPQKSFLKMTS